MAKKKVLGLTKPALVFQIDNEEPVVEFHLESANGGEVLSDTVSNLHRVLMRTQIEPLDANEQDHFARYARNLSMAYGVQVSESAAYKIGTKVCELFSIQKKS